MRKVKEFIRRNWYWVALGTVLTKFAVRYTYQERGYVAYGGEWLVLPVILMTVYLVRDVKNSINIILVEVNADAGETERDSQTVPENRRGCI